MPRRKEGIGRVNHGKFFSISGEDAEPSVPYHRKYGFSTGFVDTGGGRCYQRRAMHEEHAHEEVHGEPEAHASGRLIELTDLAVERFRAVMGQEKLGPEYGVRVSVSSGGVFR